MGNRFSGWSVVIVLIVGAMFFGAIERYAVLARTADDAGRRAQIETARIRVDRLRKVTAELEKRLAVADSLRKARPEVVVRPVPGPATPRTTRPTAPNHPEVPIGPQTGFVRDSADIVIAGVAYRVPKPVGDLLSGLLVELAHADSVAAAAGRVVVEVDTTASALEPVLEPKPPARSWLARAARFVVLPLCGAAGAGIGAIAGSVHGAIIGASVGVAACSVR
jgi:hypothetical protein